MNPEDTLAALLREEADTIVPAGDGLQKIQKRVAAKRKTRWVLPGAASGFRTGSAIRPNKLSKTGGRGGWGGLRAWDANADLLPW